jgi:hypothetical protein
VYYIKKTRTPMQPTNLAVSLRAHKHLSEKFKVQPIFSKLK